MPGDPHVRNRSLFRIPKRVSTWDTRHGASSLASNRLVPTRMLVVWGPGRETLLAIRFGRHLTHHLWGLHQATTLQLELDGAYLFILLFSFQFSFFLWTTLGFFLLFPFAFIFTSLITHICFSVIENKRSAVAPSDRRDVFGSWPFRSTSFGV